MNILQCNVTTWHEHAKHYILTPDFDAALISETHFEREKLVTAAKEARKFSSAGTGSAAISTASSGTSAGVRTRWFSKPLSICTDEAGVLCSNPRLAGWVIRSWQGNFDVHSLLRALRWFPQRNQRQFDARRVFSHERRKASIHFGSGLQFSSKLVARLVHAWRQSLVTEVRSISGLSRRNHTHAPYRQRSKARHHRLFLGVNTHQTSDTEIRNCEVSSLGSALWCEADAQHQLRIGSVQTADWKDQQAKSSQHERTPRTEHAKHRGRRPSTWERSKTQL